MSAKSASKTAFYHFNPSCSVLETNSKRAGRCLYGPGFWKGASQLQVSWNGLVSASRAGAQRSSWGPAQPQLGEMSGVCAGRGITSLVQPPFCSAFQQRNSDRSFFRTELKASGDPGSWPYGSFDLSSCSLQRCVLASTVLGNKFQEAVMQRWSFLLHLMKGGKTEKPQSS